MFSLTAEQVIGSRGRYSPHRHDANEPETRAALGMILGNHCTADEPGTLEPTRETLLTKGDLYLHFADLNSYVDIQGKVAALFRDSRAWAEKALHNVARLGKFSSDRTLVEYAREIWYGRPCSVLPSEVKP